MSTVHETLAQHVLADGFPFVFDLYKSHGSYAVDRNTGKEYLDCFSQFASMPLGWNHPVLQQQMLLNPAVTYHKIANGDCYTEWYADFVEKFASWTPDHKHLFFVAGGTLAVENALKAAFDWKVRKTGIDAQDLDVIHLERAFHGRSGYSLSLTNTTPDKTWGFPLFKWTRIESPSIYWNIQGDIHSNVEQAEHRSLSKAEEALKTGRVAAIILEPIQGEGGDNHFRKEYLKGLRDLADRYEAMLIFDEVQTGFGTTGHTWAYQGLGVVPDMICFGKKAQVCGFACNERIDEVEENVFKTSSRINSTWGGDLTDMVRSRIIMEIMEHEQTLLNARWGGGHFSSELRELSHDKNFFNVRGHGFMIAFDCIDGAMRDMVHAQLSENMLVLKGGPRSIRLRPPLNFTGDDIQKALKLISQVKVGS
jgi:L-lysine 6-transaminase